MHNCSKEFFWKISKPKISSSPMKVNLFYFPIVELFLTILLDSSGYAADAEELGSATEILAFIFYTIQLNTAP